MAASGTTGRAPGHPRLRLLGLLSLPGLWLVVAYLGSLAAMFATAFWTTDDFTGNVIHTFTTSNFRSCGTSRSTGTSPFARSGSRRQ